MNNFAVFARKATEIFMGDNRQRQNNYPHKYNNIAYRFIPTNAAKTMTKIETDEA
jgi:hypothetical protein